MPITWFAAAISVLSGRWRRSITFSALFVSSKIIEATSRTNPVRCAYSYLTPRTLEINDNASSISIEYLFGGVTISTNISFGKV